MPWNLAFQLEGSQTSKAMSESDVGLIDPATRQNSGRLAIVFAPGGVNSPAGRDSTSLIVVFASLRLERLSHERPLPNRAVGMVRMIARISAFMGDSFVPNCIAGLALF